MGEGTSLRSGVKDGLASFRGARGRDGAPLTGVCAAHCSLSQATTAKRKQTHQEVTADAQRGDRDQDRLVKTQKRDRLSLCLKERFRGTC